jgi:hypothetical protein
MMIIHPSAVPSSCNYLATRRRCLVRVITLSATLIIFLQSSQERQVAVMMSALRSSSKHYDDDDGSSSFRRTRNHQAANYSQISKDSSSSLSKYAAYDNNNASFHDDIVRISFELHDPNTKPLTNAFNLYVKCPLGEVTTGRKGRIKTGQYRDGVLPPSLIRIDDDTAIINDSKRSSSGRVLDFTTTITTNLKILAIGDSVMLQLAQAFDESLGGLEMQSRTVLWESWSGHDGGTVVSPTRGGGISAFWRLTGLLSNSRKNKPPPNSPGGGWSDVEVNTLLNHSYYIHSPISISNQSQQDQLPPRNTNQTIGSFDTVILRVMHGWMTLAEITHDRIVEAIELSYELLGATTVLLMTIPFSNNVKNENDLTNVRQINEDIREIATMWHERKKTVDNRDGGVQHVLVIEYGMYVNQVIWTNALYLNYNVSSPLSIGGAATSHNIYELEGPSFLFDRLNNDRKDFPPTIAMVCSSTPTEDGKCNRNILFSDGMHICPETLASRFAAGVACILGCVYNRRQSGANENDYSSTSMFERISICERECNEQFLSVMPVDDSWIDTNTTIASFSY